MKGKLVYIMSFLLIVTLFVCLTITYFVVERNNTGLSEFSNKYFDIIFSDPVIDFDSKMKVFVDKENDIIKVDIPDLTEFSKSNSFSIDVKNIGTVDAYVDKFFISNLNSNIETSDFNVDVSLIEDEIIKGSESEKIIITLTYYGKNVSTIESPYISFDLNYLFKEVIL
jgi:hypothetical protein